jgi:hypothetical protein
MVIVEQALLLKFIDTLRAVQLPPIFATPPLDCAGFIKLATHSLDKLSSPFTLTVYSCEMPDPATEVTVSKNDLLALSKHMLILKHATRSPETSNSLPLTVGPVAGGEIASVIA